MPSFMLLLLLFGVMLISFTSLRRALPAVLYATVGEEDIKIAPGPGIPASAAQARRREENEEAATQAYLRQRRIGNTQKAAELGTRLADEIIIAGYPDIPGDVPVGQYLTELKVLCAFAVNRALEEHAPNAIAGHSALSSFYDALQERDSDFYEAISESSSFSFYMYLYRAESVEPMAFATAFAEVCGNKGSTGCFEAGLAAYTAAYDHTAALIRGIDFK